MATDVREYSASKWVGLMSKYGRDQRPCPACGGPGAHWECMQRAVGLAQRLYGIVTSDELGLESLVRDLCAPEWDWLRVRGEDATE